ncbi:unnamed protein product [Caenorhabditis angaria]|uniref:Profilin n=1 Tax=Caenorhabditis angaria TaxID=860376 RepID=A0A9P1NAV2_9PELO|nr:unnamed protein product [Caenorhabditis angaria]
MSPEPQRFFNDETNGYFIINSSIFEKSFLSFRKNQWPLKKHNTAEDEEVCSFCLPRDITHYIVNNNLIGSGNVSKAAICGFDGAIWAKSDNFDIDVEEAVAAGKSFAQQDALLGTGLRFEKKKYLVLNADDDRIIGKQGASGFFIYKTTQAVIISIYEQGLQPEQCSKTTGALADYFKSIGY